MKVLQICHKPPLPSTDGGCIAINNISKGLIKELGSIKVLTINTLKHPFDLKNFDKNNIDRIVKNAEEDLKKENINDQERFILNQKIEVLNSLKLN